MSTTGKGKGDVYELDPIQGHDVRVTTSPYGLGDSASTDTGGNGSPTCAFTDILVKVVVQTETFLPLCRKVPRYLDGEVIIVWSASGGVIDFNFVSETFGNQFASSIASGRSVRVRRSNRFSITAQLDIADASDKTQSDSNIGVEGFNNGYAYEGHGTKLELLYCRCDTLTFGIQAGKGYAVNSWQGTAEGIKSPTVNGSTKKGIVTSTT